VCGKLPSNLNYIYKKIDSTLRGQPASELMAMMEALGVKTALVAPAFPSQGRTTVGGRQRVDGVPVEETSFGRAVHRSDLLALFGEEAGNRRVQLVELSAVRRGAAAVSEALNAPEPKVVVADAETDEDLAILARGAMIARVKLFCGTAGLARALVKVLPLAPSAPTPKPPTFPAGPVLVVAGSRNPRTIRQVESAQSRDAMVVTPDNAFLGGDMAALEETLRRIGQALASGRNVILTTKGTDDSPLGSRPVAARLASVACEMAIRRMVGGLVVTGGDVAAEVCTALGASALWLRGELQPGIPWGVLSDGVATGLRVVTKAGGFGGDDALAAAISHLGPTELKG
jgi:uncharacterized protein YgbK (DUF1537 family)